MTDKLTNQLTNGRTNSKTKVSPSGDQKKKVKTFSKVKIFSEVELYNIFRGKGFVLIITRTLGNVRKLRPCSFETFEFFF